MRSAVGLGALCAVGLLALASPAGAANPQALVEVTALSEVDVFVDSATIRRDGEMVTAWMLMVPAKPQTGNGKPEIATAFRLLEDCKARTYQDIGAANYTEDGPGQVDATKEPAQPAPEGTVAASVLDYICFDKRMIDDPTVYRDWRLAYAAARKTFDTSKR
jgi:hypothetical protein